MNLSSSQKNDLALAASLIAWGVPVFRCEPDRDEGGEWIPRGGHQGTGYWLPKRWQATEPSMDVLRAWRPGDALCLVTGVVVDVLDVDPQNGGDESWAVLKVRGLMPKVHGEVTTPSGGRHYYIAPLGVASWNGVLGLPGLDLKSGCADGSGRGFVFIPPTVKLSKVSGLAVSYEF